jgi:hypothetical protein
MAVLLERVEDRFFAVFDFSKLVEPVPYGGNSDFVQAAGGFFSVTGNKRDGGPFDQKVGYRLNVIVAYVLLPGDFGCECVVLHAFFDLPLQLLIYLYHQ